ncbi:hypothetical protein AVEN_246850-1 [Araneus ventricosus]|uniref:Uncharacterized protein n=1 Tax=Araneus ventricosus TaxID=182803 RepID=A0A4Y2KYN5_ARAVE|nr:hypothetical protein AVEN_246850-1 [Araneus ventricosus]
MVRAISPINLLLQIRVKVKTVHHLAHFSFLRMRQSACLPKGSCWLYGPSYLHYTLVSDQVEKRRWLQFGHILKLLASFSKDFRHLRFSDLPGLIMWLSWIKSLSLNLFCTYFT